MLSGIGQSVSVRIEYANMAKMNRLRAWARKNGARVQSSRYAMDAYEGQVVIATPWNEGRIVTERKLAECKAILAAK